MPGKHFPGSGKGLNEQSPKIRALHTFLIGLIFYLIVFVLILSTSLSSIIDAIFEVVASCLYIKFTLCCLVLFR